MLTPAQVVPFLTHADPLVRRHAVTYFRGANDAAPLTAADVWAAVDRLGGPAADDAKPIVTHLAALPQDATSVPRLIAALAEVTSATVAHDLRAAVRALPFPVLVSHADELLNCPDLEADDTALLSRRLALADEPADAAWDKLMAHGIAMAAQLDADDGADLDDDDDAWDAGQREATALIEAAARHVDGRAGGGSCRTAATIST